MSMHSLRKFRGWVIVAFATLLVAPVVRAQGTVPYVPTPQVVVDRMLEMGKVGRGDYLIDLGSGDGRIVVTAAQRHGTSGYGVDLNPVRIEEAHANARKAGVTDKVAFYQRDLFETDLTAATVITMYLLPQVNLALRPKLLELKPGTRIVSHDFTMAEWQPDAHVELPAPDKYGGAGGTSDIYVWIVPAKLAGEWRWELPLRSGALTYVLEATQQFQRLAGAVRIGSDRVPLDTARITGDAIEFSFTAPVGGSPVRHDFKGRVQGDVIDGTVQLNGARSQSTLQWDARKTR